jgi:hypothetical protein
MSRKRFLVLAALAVTLAVPVVSCSRNQAPVRDARAEAAATAAQRLQGRWILTTFQPDVPLDPVMQLLLRDQIDHLVVDFKGQTLTAQGPGVTINRTYRVDEAYVDHFKATIFDAYGVGMETSCDFSGNMLLITGLSAPWRGRASFRRAL